MTLRKKIFNYFWAFWMYLGLWMLLCILGLYGFISLVEWTRPSDSDQILTDQLLEILMYGCSVGFVIYVFILYKRKQKYYSGLITDVLTEEEDSDSSALSYRHFIILVAEDRKHKIQLDPVSFKKLKTGMRVKMRYDSFIRDAKEIILVK